MRIVTSKSLFGLCRLGVVLVCLAGLLVVVGSASAVLVQQQTITQTDGAANDYFGRSVALSSDGNTAIVGAYKDNSTQGSATIFTRSGGVWTQQQTITQSDGAGDDYFGSSVALSSDGNTAIVGASEDDVGVGVGVDQGSATIFTRSGGVWSQQGTITQSDGAGSDWFGNSVALSSDGNTAIVGAWFDDVGSDTNQGSATVFTRSGTTWTQQGSAIFQSAGTAYDFFGYSVALSSDGNTAIIGARSGDGTITDQGSATIFTRSGTTWTEQGTITQFGGAASDDFGFSVALSSDGNTAIVGAREDDSSQGSASIFTRSGTTWTQQQTITQTGGAANDSFGQSVALSSDGNTAIVGAYGGNSAGSASIFTRSGTTWTQQQTITQTGGAVGDRFGWSVALSSDGNTAIVSANGDNSYQGSATIFTNATVSGVPTSVSGTSGANAQSVVSWTAPVSDGGSPITGYTVTASPGGASCSWTSGALSCTVTGLTNSTSYALTVTATNAAGTSAASAPSNTITPTAPATTAPATTAPATTAPATTAPATPTSVKWTKPSITTPLVATFTATTGTTYLITATLTKAAKTLRIATTKGTCKIKSGKTTCIIKLKTRGTWSVTITPKKNGSLGMPVKKTVKV